MNIKVGFFMCLLMSCVLAGAETKSSLFDLKTVWKNQNNQDKVLKDFSGQPTLISMVYTSCAHTCPMTISKIQGIKKMFEDAGYKNVKYVLASFDPQNDTPENLKKYMIKRKLDEKQWEFLSPKDDSTARELSVILGISYKKLDDSDFSHSNVITLLNKEGVPIARIDSLSAETNSFLTAIKK